MYLVQVVIVWGTLNTVLLYLNVKSLFVLYCYSDMQYCLDYYCDRKDHAVVRTIQKPKGTCRTDYSEIPLSEPYG